MITSLFKDEKELERLSKSLQKAVKNPATLELLKNISADLSLSQEQENNFTDIVFSIIRGEVELYDCVSLISGVLKIDFDRALEINDRLYENLFFGIESDINDQFVLYQKTKMPIKEYAIQAEDIKKSQKEKSEFLPLIDKAVKKFNLFAAPHPTSVLPLRAGKMASAFSITEPEASKEREEVELKKFSEIADTFLSGVRTKMQFKNTLTKPIADGGLQMAPQLADDVADFLASYSRLQPVIAKSEAAKQSRPSASKLPPSEKGDKGGFINPPRPSLSEGGSSRPVPPNVKIEVSFEKEEKEAAVSPSVIPAKAGIQSPPTLTKKDVDFSREEKEAAAKKPKIEKMRIAAPKLLSVTEGVKNALAELNYTFPSSELQERLKSIIDARVRNVRTSLQTFDKLTQDIPSGGMGFSKLEADKVSLVLNKYLEEKNKDIYGSKLAEIKQAEDEEKKKNEERARAAEEIERKNFDERFTKLTGKASAPLPVIASPSEGAAISPALTKSEIAVKKSIPLPPEEAPAFVIARSEEKRSDAVIPPQTRSPRPSAASGLAMTSRERPVLEDIKFIPKLAGPTEEIARLTLEDFRKLSGDPKEAILKIKDKLALLRGESYKKYQAGIDAWRNSPLYGEYLKIINRSLEDGLPLDGAISASQTLTKDEFDGIMESRIE